MSIIINTNVPALIARNALDRATASLNSSMEKLSTGYRINHAADDPAGYYYASGLSSQLRGSKVAYQNVSQSQSMLTLAQGDLSAINDQLERIKELATEYSNDTLTTEQKTAIKAEAQQRVDEINRIVEESKFNDVKLLDGSKEGVRFQIGAYSDPATNAINVNGVFLDASTGETGIKLFGSGADEFADIEAAFKDSSTAAKFIDIVQASADTVTERIATAGVYSSRLESIADRLLTQNENLASAYSSVMDTDISSETANYVKQQILQQTASAMLIQANQASGIIALKLIGAS